jgi:Cu(I)/Ag(I) efflux system periplasmic protein CusF
MRLALALFVSISTAAALAESPKPARFGPNEGEVLQVDREAREITIRHGPLPELSMDPMSMVFVVADPRVFDGVRKGDRVKFKPGLIDGRFGVISIEPIRRRSDDK